LISKEIYCELRFAVEV